MSEQTSRRPSCWLPSSGLLAASHYRLLQIKPLRTALLLVVLILLSLLPALAGKWVPFGSNSGTRTYATKDPLKPGRTVSWTDTNPTKYTNSIGWNCPDGSDYDYMGPNFGSPYPYSVSTSGTVTITFIWVPSTSAASDPPPAKVYIIEDAFAYWSGGEGYGAVDGATPTVTGTVNDGRGDPCITTAWPQRPNEYPGDSFGEATTGDYFIKEVDGSSGKIVCQCTLSGSAQGSDVQYSTCYVACAFAAWISNYPPIRIYSTSPSNPNPIILTSSTSSVPLSATLVGRPNDTVKVTPTLYDSAQNQIVSLPAQTVTLDASGNGTASFTWNGTKSDGTAAPPGIYLFQYTASSSSTSNTDTDKSPYLTITTPGTDAQLVSDDGTNAQFAISYTLSSTDSPARSAAAGQIDVYDPNQAKVITQTLSAGDLTPGAHTIIVSLPSPQVTGDYIFLISAQDNDADNDKAGRQRWALQHNTKYKNIPPIIYINSDMWHVAWCVAGRNVNRATLDIPISERAAHYVPNLIDNVNTSDVRAGINGAVYNNRVDPPVVIGGVGTGTPGAWHIGGYSDRPLFCFGMTGSGNGFGQAQMKKISLLVQRKGRSYRVDKYTVATNIEKQYPYGFGTVGLIIDNGVPRSHSYLKQWDTRQLGYPPGGQPVPVPRTAAGWTANGDFFLISYGPKTTTPGVGATWEDVQSFLITTLPQLIQQQYKKTITISNAVMMDGGGSVQFAYRWQHSDGSILKSDNDAPQGDNDRAIPSAISVYATTDK